MVLATDHLHMPATTQPHLFTGTGDTATHLFTARCVVQVRLKNRQTNRVVQHCHQVPSSCYCSPAAPPTHTRTHTKTLRPRLIQDFVFLQQLSDQSPRCYTLSYRLCAVTSSLTARCQRCYGTDDNTCSNLAWFGI